MSGFKVGITVRRARPEVASVMFDVNYLTGWLSGVSSVVVDSGAPPGVGATVALGNGRHADIFEIVEHQPDLLLVLEGETLTITLALEGVPVGTVAWLGIETERKGLRRLFRRVLDGRARRVAIRDLRRLKRLIESGEYRTWWVEDDPPEGVD
jgi:hypothetical protein